MARRWSLIAVIAVLAGSLAYVLFGIVSDKGDSGKPPPEAKKPAPPPVHAGWWPAHATSGKVIADAEGDHHAQLTGGASWTSGPQGGAVLLDGTGYAETAEPVLRTKEKDYSVAAWVRLDSKKEGRFATALSQDAGKGSAFYLQYSGADKRFAFSAGASRALAREMGPPKRGHWYHLAGVYRAEDQSIRGPGNRGRGKATRNRATGGGYGEQAVAGRKPSCRPAVTPSSCR